MHPMRSPQSAQQIVTRLQIASPSPVLAGGLPGGSRNESIACSGGRSANGHKRPLGGNRQPQAAPDGQPQQPLSTGPELPGPVARSSRDGSPRNRYEPRPPVRPAGPARPRARAHKVHRAAEKGYLASCSSLLLRRVLIARPCRAWPGAAREANQGRRAGRSGRQGAAPGQRNRGLQQPLAADLQPLSEKRYPAKPQQALAPAGAGAPAGRSGRDRAAQRRVKKPSSHETPGVGEKCQDI